MIQVDDFQNDASLNRNVLEIYILGIHDCANLFQAIVFIKIYCATDYAKAENQSLISFRKSGCDNFSCVNYPSRSQIFLAN